MQWKRNSVKLAFDKGDTLQDMFLSLNIKGRAKKEQKVHILALHIFQLSQHDFGSNPKKLSIY